MPAWDTTQGPSDWLELHIAGPGILLGAIALLYALVNTQIVKGMKTGKDIDIPLLDKLAQQVRSGSYAFLKIEYMYLGIFVAATAVVLLVMFFFKPIDKDQYDDNQDGPRTAFAFIMGAGLSALAGFMGMDVATLGNVRTTVACTEGSLNDGLKAAFKAGSVMGFTVVGLGLGGLSLMFLIQAQGRNYGITMEILSAFGFGASAIALFARVAGGIYTKAADVGADLVGKVEAGINEDDPHNPAVIADNVGDNVGDVAGMGADLFESYVGSIIAAGTLATNESIRQGYAADDARLYVLPFALAAVGILSSAVGTLAVGTKQEGRGWDVKLGQLMWGLEKGMYLAAGLFMVLSAGVIYALFDESLEFSNKAPFIKPYGWRLYTCIIMGLISGALIGKVTEYFTSFDFGPVISIKDRGRTGPATVVIQGIGVGMISCAPPVIILAITILACAELSGNYGIAIAAVGMLATLGITLATDAYGPVADNAGGLAEMAGLGPEVRAKTDSLDALGNTTAATGKGFAIGSAVLTSLSLLAAFREKIVGPDLFVFDISDSTVMAGALIGAMLPYVFAAMTMISVGKAAAEIIEEVRRQFREIPGLRNAIERASRGETIPPEEDVEPDSDRCVAISTQSSVVEMIAPGAYAILAPVFVGFFVGPKCLMGMLAGAITSGAMVAIMMSNAGGAWDNSKKLCEKLNIKKTDQGNACIIGDTVGDPFKDTSGPALNILIKLMSMVSLLIAPFLENQKDWAQWEYGLLPALVFVIITVILVAKGVLTWVDPLSILDEANNPAKSAAEVEKQALVDVVGKPAPADDGTRL
jgi:H(+)-translocating pyrophosphatase